MRADSKPPVQIADDTELLLGMRGKFEGESFALVGRAHVESKTGGHWNEWRAVFENGKEGWLAEAATRFYFMFEAPILDVEHAPPGSVASARYTIVERNEATRTQTWGEVDPADGFVFRYVDLSSDDGRVATMDFTGEYPLSFLGRRVTLDELGLLAARERNTST